MLTKCAYFLLDKEMSLREKCPNTDFFSGPYFPVFGLNTERYAVFSPNAEKCGPEKTPYLYTFHAVFYFDLDIKNSVL